jgi:hypothetical protein
MHFRCSDVKNVNQPMNAKVKQRIIIKFLSNEETDAIKIHHRLLRAFQENICTPSSAYEWLSLFKTGREISWTSTGPENGGSITSIPKFCHYSKKMNLRVFDRLFRSRTFL